MHDALARIQQVGEIPFVLKQLQTQGLISETVAEKMQRQMEAILGLPVFANWRTGNMQRLAERALITEKRELRRPDWVLYNNGETLVIDFKFTEDDSSNPTHKTQVSEYMQLLSKAGFIGIKGFVLYGNSLQVVEVPFI
jgi:CRISPR/Cas system-associated exonuclease Cas4 (RecB family)